MNSEISSLKYNYTLLIATDSFKDALCAMIENLSDITFLRIVIVVNGPNSFDSMNRYLKSVNSKNNIEFETVLIKGKSNALNHYIKRIKDINTFLIFTDDDIEFNKENVFRYIEEVEKNGTGFFYGGAVQVKRKIEIDQNTLKLYPASIRGVSDAALQKATIFLGCNWGAFAEDMQLAGFFNPYFGPGSITGSVGQESQMMRKLLENGIKPFPIYNCRVTHYAPENYYTLRWLLKRKYREGIQKGLLSNGKFLNVFFRKSLRIFQKNNIKRKSNLYFILGMLYSLKYYFKKIER